MRLPGSEVPRVSRAERVSVFDVRGRVLERRAGCTPAAADVGGIVREKHFTAERETATMNYYRTIRAEEELSYDRLIGNDALKLFCLRHKLSPAPTLQFLVEDPFGEHQFEGRILGFAIGRRQIFIRAGLNTLDLISTIAHEVRHCWQAMSGRHGQNIETRERDARIYELELGLLPRDPKELRRWLWTELMCAEKPELRESWRLAEEIMARRNGSERTLRQPQQAAVNDKKRIEFIQRNLAELPHSRFHWQRQTLLGELDELVRRELVRGAA